MVVKIEEKLYAHHVESRRFRITVDYPKSRRIIKTTLTSDPSMVDQWIKKKLPPPDEDQNNKKIVIGFGVQWTLPDAHEVAPAATIQLCYHHRCLIFHAFHAPYFPTSLHNVLSNEKFTFVGLYTDYDAFKIQLLLDQKPWLQLQTALNSEIIRPGMPIDIRHHVFDKESRSLKYSSVKQIVCRVLKFDLTYEDEGSVMFSDWEDETLSLEQVGFASVDAFVSCHVGVHRRAWKRQNSIFPRPII